MYIKRFGRALTELLLDCGVNDSLDWELSRQQLRYVVKCCPNLREFYSREATTYRNTDLKSISKSTSIQRICFEETELVLDDHFIKHLSRMQNLVELTLYPDHAVRPDIAAILAGCPQIQRFSAGHVASLEQIANENHPNLVHLEIRQSDLRQDQLMQIALLRNVRSLDLTYSLRSLEPLDILQLVQDMPALTEVVDHGVADWDYEWDSSHPTWVEVQRVVSERKMN